MIKWNAGLAFMEWHKFIFSKSVKICWKMIEVKNKFFSA